MINLNSTYHPTIFDLEPLEPIPKDVDFINGNGYILQDPDIINKIKKYFSDKYGSFEMTGRLLDDINETFLYTIWSRVYAIDEQNREWGQPFYAKNPHQATQICHNPEFEKILLKRKRQQKLDIIESIG